ncbi:MAG TPA: flagellar biosynthesis anti-sigma factor FlgM [Rubrivivax sp.]|nr:flagellar biosynthesis anti-sigma factor FlgM [Burkholderiales bacterium]HNU10054.1 flagellar biosynthesis anti-sigma factor FlgM [Rubrivivax sp.]
MKIGPLDKTPPVQPAVTERKAPGAASNGNGSAGVAAVKGTPVAISAEASALARAADDGGFDAAKVERISQAIKDGSYRIDPEAIADKLIANARELLERTYR